MTSTAPTTTTPHHDQQQPQEQESSVIRLRPAKQSDAKDVAKLADSIDVAVMDDPITTGFLAANYTEQDYSKFIQESDFSFTLHYIPNKNDNTTEKDEEDEEEGELIGFLVAYQSESIHFDKDEFANYIQTNICHSTQPFVTVKQVFLSVKPEHRRKGYGSLLYKELYTKLVQLSQQEQQQQNNTSSSSSSSTTTPLPPRPVFADIVQTPDNAPSRIFHTKLGFETIGTFVRKRDNRKILIFCNKDVTQSLKAM